MVFGGKPPADAHKKHNITQLILCKGLTNVDEYINDANNDMDLRIYVLQHYEVVKQWLKNYNLSQTKVNADESTGKSI